MWKPSKVFTRCFAVAGAESQEGPVLRVRVPCPYPPEEGDLQNFHRARLARSGPIVEPSLSDSNLAVLGFGILRFSVQRLGLRVYRV